MKIKINLKLDKIIEFVNVFFKSVQDISWDILNRPLNLDIYFFITLTTFLILLFNPVKFLKENTLLHNVCRILTSYKIIAVFAITVWCHSYLYNFGERTRSRAEWAHIIWSPRYISHQSAQFRSIAYCADDSEEGK